MEFPGGITMIVNHNISALNTLNKLQKNNKANANVLEKLSSGLNINRASDDSAGLAISEKMRGQIRGLEQAQRNIQDGISLIQTAESGLASIQTPPLQRLRELAIQASNDTLTNADRQKVQEEVEQIKKGINEIANNTKFNDIDLLNEAPEIETITEETSIEKTISETKEIMSPGTVLYTKFKNNPTGGEIFGVTESVGGEGIVFTFQNPPSDPSLIYVEIGKNVEETLNNMKDKFHAIKNGLDGTHTQQEFINSNNVKFEVYGNNPVFIADYNLATSYGGGTGGTFDGAHSFGVGTTATINYEKTIVENVTEITEIKIYNKLSLQIGANSEEKFQLELTDATTTALGIDDIDFSTRNGAESAISKIDNALKTVSSERSKFGAYQNRLEHIHNNASNYQINLTSAESRIRDADIAKQMMKFAKSQILTQASQIMLAQSINQPQQVLQLLK